MKIETDIILSFCTFHKKIKHIYIYIVWKREKLFIPSYYVANLDR